MDKNNKYFVCVFVLLGSPLAFTLKIYKMEVPNLERSIFNCEYDLEGDALYMVKWYKNNNEIYRCYNDGSVAVFPTNNLYIRAIDGERQLKKHSCAFRTSGQTSYRGLPGEYTCEVTGNAPSFATVMRSVTMPPIEHFLMTTEQPRRMVVSTGSSYSTSTINFHISLTILMAVNNLLISY